MKKPILTSVFFLLAAAVLSGAENNFSLSGYYKNFSTAFLLPSYDLSGYDTDSPDLGAVNNRLRLKLTYKPAAWFSLDAAYDITPRIQDPQLFSDDIFFADLEFKSYRFDDFKQQIYPKADSQTGSFGLFHNLDRFFFTITTKYADVFIGRQAIAWGSAHFINPTDVIAPFTFNELDVEERRGVDAVRVRIPLGMMDELDLGYVAGKDFFLDNSAFFIRGKTYLFQTDLSLLLMSFRSHFLFGLDITRSIGGAGFWVEGAYVSPYSFCSCAGAEKKNYIRLSTGLDYTFTATTYGFFEYHFSSAGKKDPSDYLIFLESSAFKDGSVYLMGRHYLCAGITQQITPLIPFTGLIIWNASDGSLTLAPQAEYNIAENIYIALGAYVGFGKKPDTLLHSEFGAYPDMIFSSFRIYF
jgi:hypothetical protein